jgi:hypothetical protein
MTRNRDLANIPSLTSTPGDILSVSAADTPSAIPIQFLPNNPLLIVDSTTTQGAGWQDVIFTQVAAGKNAVINGAFDVWQRGTTFSFSSNNGYTADRWMAWSSSAGTITYSRQVNTDTTRLPNVQYLARVQRNSGQTGTPYSFFGQTIETINCIPLAGKTVTMSFYARKGSNFSGASNIMAAQLNYGTGADQDGYVPGLTGSTALISQSVTLTDQWQRFNYTATIPATATQLQTSFYYLPTGTAGVNDYFEVTGIQLEVGSVATPFSRTGGDISSETALCQRYYYRNFPAAISKHFGYVSAASTTSAILTGQFPVKMRTTPTALEQSGTANQYAVVFAATTTCSAVPTYNAITTSTHYGVNLTVSTGLTASQGGRAGTDATNGAGAYLGWSAEL